MIEVRGRRQEHMIPRQAFRTSLQMTVLMAARKIPSVSDSPGCRRITLSWRTWPQGRRLRENQSAANAAVRLVRKGRVPESEAGSARNFAKHRPTVQIDCHVGSYRLVIGFVR